MYPRTPAPSPTFLLVAKELVALHRLIRDGKDDSPEAEAVRDALDGPLNALNPTEKERAQWLSEDLYSGSEPPPEERKAMTAEAQQQFAEAFEAKGRGEWDRALILLRRWQTHIAPEVLSYARGAIWLDVGSRAAAAAFFEHALECDPDNVSYRTVYQRALDAGDPADAAPMLSEIPY